MNAYRQQNGTADLDVGEPAVIRFVYWDRSKRPVASIVAIGNPDTHKRDDYGIVPHSERHDVLAAIRGSAHLRTISAIESVCRGCGLLVE